MKTELKINKKKDVKKYIQSSSIFIIMMFFLTITLLSFWSGIFTIDSDVQWWQVEKNNITNNHPFFSTFFWWLLARIWYNPTVLLIFQMILLSAIWTFICYSLKNQKNFKKTVIYTIFICFIPIIFFYSITAWKDIIYSYMLLFISIMIYNGIKKGFNYSYWNLFAIDFALAFVWSYRYNGVITSTLILLTLVIVLGKHKINIKKIISFIAMFILILGVFKIPEKIMCHPQINQSGNDIAIYILASLVKEDKIDNEEDKNIINQIYPIDKLKEEYDPYVINPISVSKYYNRDIGQKYSKDIIRILVKYTIKHPITIIRHYLKVDNLLIGLSFGDGYVYIYQFDYWETKYSGNFDGMVQPIFKQGYDFYLKLINMTTSSIILRKFYLPAYALYGSIILIILYARRIKEKRLLLILIPMIFNTISLLPINIAQDLRYVYINYLTLIMLVIPLFIFRYPRIVEVKSDNKKINKDKTKTLIIVPAYNEEKNLEAVITDIRENSNYDYIIINDCSKDGTLNVCKKNCFNYLSLPVNYGLSSGIQLGMKYALENNYDIVIQFDGDGQHKAKYLEKLVEMIQNENYDIVIGSRFITKKKPKSLRMLGSRIISFCIKITTGQTIKDPTSGMRAYNKDTIEEFVKDSSLTPEPDTLAYMIKRGKKIKEVQVEMQERMYGESYLKPIKAAEYMLNIIASIVFFRNFQK